MGCPRPVDLPGFPYYVTGLGFLPESVPGGTCSTQSLYSGERSTAELVSAGGDFTWFLFFRDPGGGGVKLGTFKISDICMLQTAPGYRRHSIETPEALVGGTHIRFTEPLELMSLSGDWTRQWTTNRNGYTIKTGLLREVPVPGQRVSEKTRGMGLLAVIAGDSGGVCGVGVGMSRAIADPGLSETLKALRARGKSGECTVLMLEELQRACSEALGPAKQGE